MELTRLEIFSCGDGSESHINTTTWRWGYGLGNHEWLRFKVRGREVKGCKAFGCPLLASDVHRSTSAIQLSTTKSEMVMSNW